MILPAMHGALNCTLRLPLPLLQVGMGEEYAEKDGVQYRIRCAQWVAFVPQLGWRCVQQASTLRGRWSWPSRASQFSQFCRIFIHDAHAALLTRRRRWTQDENGTLQILSAVPVGAAQANGSAHAANGGSSHLGGSSAQLAAPQAVEMARKDE